jgi:hypothetical protein
MGRLNLEASTQQEKLILKYLEAHASLDLEEKINSGTKTLADCWAYITGKAKEKAVKGCAVISDDVVYGWAMHFFEEDDIKVKPKDQAKPSVSTSTPTIQNVVKPKKTPKISDDQISLFDLFGEDE